MSPVTSLARQTVLPLPRLKRRPEFLRVAREGRKWAAPGLVLQACERRVRSGAKTDRRARIGFTVTKKVGNAVIRNRVRRRLKADAETVFAAHGAADMDFVVIGRAATIKRPFKLLVSDLEKALRKLDAEPK